MDILNQVRARGEDDTVVHRWRNTELTFRQLESRSNAIAHRILELGLPKGAPIVVYGHKQLGMLPSFLGCVKAGHPYVPVDSSLPPNRVQTIVESAAAPLVLAVQPIEVAGPLVLNWEELAELADAPVQVELSVGHDDPYYIIYTSGSTGTPKGVQISRRSVESFVGWALSLVGPGPHVFLNQAPFSFDLSVFELAMSQASGGRIHSIDKDHLLRFRDLFAELKESGITVWVSTPSFADMCLAAPEFSHELLPRLETFLFCGETLTHETATRLRERFPGVRVINTYGPTESTVAVTSVLCDDNLLAAHTVLPVGTPKPGTRIDIVDPAGNVVQDGVTGEIVIVGDTVSLGYYLREDLSETAFGVWMGSDGPVRTYRTGDAGYLRDGMLHFIGRLDFQIKLHGYRIEIEDVEANLRKLEGVTHAVVLPMGEPAVTHLHAVLQLSGGVPSSGLKQTIALKRKLKELVPDYMVPKQFTYVDAIPLTNNGKADRASLKANL